MSIPSLQFNVDGLPLFKSSSFALSPILGIIPEEENPAPFVISVWVSPAKPRDSNELLVHGAQPRTLSDQLRKKLARTTQEPKETGHFAAAISIAIMRGNAASLLGCLEEKLLTRVPQTKQCNHHNRQPRLMSIDIFELITSKLLEPFVSELKKGIQVHQKGYQTVGPSQR
jgi:hypothetical protein